VELCISGKAVIYDLFILKDTDGYSHLSWAMAAGSLASFEAWMVLPRRIMQ